jgi:hypothetical protein
MDRQEAHRIYREEFKFFSFSKLVIFIFVFSVAIHLFAAFTNYEVLWFKRRATLDDLDSISFTSGVRYDTITITPNKTIRKLTIVRKYYDSDGNHYASSSPYYFGKVKKGAPVSLQRPKLISIGTPQPTPARVEYEITIGYVASPWILHKENAS